MRVAKNPTVLNRIHSAFKPIDEKHNHWTANISFKRYWNLCLAVMTLQDRKVELDQMTDDLLRKLVRRDVSLRFIYEKWLMDRDVIRQSFAHRRSYQRWMQVDRRLMVKFLKYSEVR